MPAAATDFSQKPIVFTHIPKTAGTTLNAVLEGAFPERCLFHLQRLDPQDLRARAADPTLYAYGGHVDYQRMSAAFTASGRGAHYITVLRDPIDRILSAYSYAKATAEARRWHELASRHDINAFIAIMADQHRQFLVSKQCRFVGAVERADADQALLSLKENYSVVGTQADLEGFLKRLEQQCGLQLPRSAPRNRSAKPVTRADLDKKSLRILDRTTREDRRLFDMVMEWLGK